MKKPKSISMDEAINEEREFVDQLENQISHLESEIEDLEFNKFGDDNESGDMDIEIEQKQDELEDLKSQLKDAQKEILKMGKLKN